MGVETSRRGRAAARATAEGDSTNPWDLRYPVAVADHGHFCKAALACHVSQPPLSAQLSKLEAHRGVALFERTSRSVHVTLAGTREPAPPAVRDG
jgi:Bacterial regulatory helix-turn-helix protein, lysR family